MFKYAVSRMADVSVELMERHNLTANDVAFLIPHQANMRIIDATGKRMGLSSDKILINIQKYGNTAGTSIRWFSGILRRSSKREIPLSSLLSEPVLPGAHSITNGVTIQSRLFACIRLPTRAKRKLSPAGWGKR